ncbi:sugar ABC transporter permease [Mesorhizobium sp. C120A]|uniref:carbohydrate ABC transporter permease n=1 Tax=Mesorhizobium sp. C120A TaxID=2956824 RepID=UPI002578401D|nr:sugar ABC transporter permease [Mesorhizobium sp. C120A]WJI46522.1 sugar ABC transporter permease [Mesorhizobium sp. C120A]
MPLQALHISDSHDRCFKHAADTTPYRGCCPQLETRHRCRCRRVGHINGGLACGCLLLGGGRRGGVGRGRIYRQRVSPPLLRRLAGRSGNRRSVCDEYLPLLWSLGLSFFAYQANQQTIRFVGLGNYIRILTNDLAAHATWGALINTAMFVVFTVSAQMIVGFLLAILFAKQFPLRKYLLILVLTPMMLSVVASGVFFTYYYDPTFGILSYVINSISGNQFILMSNKVGAVAGIVFADAWMWSPFVMLLVLAGLVSVPKYLYEAAAIDRISSWRQFWMITFPYIRGLLMLALLFRTIEAFKLADLVILLTKGGNDTLTISYHLIRIANEQNKTSEGASISYLMLFMVIVLTNLYLYLANRRTQGA